MCWINQTFAGYILLCFCFRITTAGNLVKITNPPADKIADKGHTITFECEVTAAPVIDKPHFRIRWKHNDEHINTKSAKYQLMENGQTLIIRDIEPQDAGVYSCIAGIRGYKDKDKSSAKLSVKGPPDPPWNLKIAACLGFEAELTWEDGSNNGENITSYLVQYNTTNNPFYWNSVYDEVLATESKKTNSHFVHLVPWGKYSFRVLAKNSLGYSEPSKPTSDSCDTPPSRPTTNPDGVKTITNTKDKLIIQWNPMPRSQHHGPSLSYEVSYRRKGSTYWHQKTVSDPNENRLEIDVDDVYGLYEVKVQAKNSFGYSFQPPFVKLGRSGEAEPLVSPKDFRIDPDKSIGPHTAYFIWEPVDTSEDVIRGEFRGYRIQYWKSSEGRRNLNTSEVFGANSKHTPFLDVRGKLTGLPANVALRAQVSVVNGQYAGPPSVIIDFKTPEGVPGPVRNLEEEKIESNYALLKWLPPDEPNGVLLGYDIGYQAVNGEENGDIRALEPKISNPSTLMARITGLQADHEYRFFVWARTKAGKGKAVSIDVKTLPDKRTRFTYDSHNSQVASIHQGFNFAARTFPRNLCLLFQVMMTYFVILFVFH